MLDKANIVYEISKTKSFCLFLLEGEGKVKVIDVFKSTSPTTECTVWTLYKVYLHAAFSDSHDLDIKTLSIAEKKKNCLIYSYHEIPCDI